MYHNLPWLCIPYFDVITYHSNLSSRSSDVGNTHTNIDTTGIPNEYQKDKKVPPCHLAGISCIEMSISYLSYLPRCPFDVTFETKKLKVSINFWYEKVKNSYEVFMIVCSNRCRDKTGMKTTNKGVDGSNVRLKWSRNGRWKQSSLFKSSRIFAQQFLSMSTLA